MIDAVTNKNSIFYTERVKFDFLLNNSGHWFTSGTHGLNNLSLNMIACYTAERKLNYLNDLAEFINNNYDEIMRIHGETLRFVKRDARWYFGTYLCAAITYNLNNKMIYELSESLLEVLNLIDLTSYYDGRFFKQNTKSKLENLIFNYNSEDEYTIDEMYKILEHEIYYNHNLNENNLSFGNMRSAVRTLDMGRRVGGDVLTELFNTNENSIKSITTETDKTLLDNYIKEITMKSYECVHKILCSI